MDEELQARNYRLSWPVLAIIFAVCMLAYIAASAFGTSAIGLIAGTTGGYLFARITGF